MKRIPIFLIIWILLRTMNVPIGAAEQMGEIMVETDSSKLTQETMAVYCIAEARMEGSKRVYYWKEEFDMEEVEIEKWVARFSEKDMKTIEEKAEKTNPLQIESFDADGKIQVIVRPGIYLLKQWDKKEAWIQSILAIVPEMDLDGRTWNYERKYNAKYTLEPLIPQTGDLREEIWVWIVTGSISVAAVLGFVSKYRKSEKNIDRR